MKSYEQAEQYLLSGRNGEDRPLPGRSTRLQRREDGSIAVKYHDTDVVTYRADGSTVLDSGGFRTVTTKSRMNEYTCAHIYQDRGEWYLRLRSVDAPDGWETHIFRDGMTLGPDGQVQGAGSKTEVKRRQVLARKINRYAADFADALLAGKVQPPGPGDCWLCSMRVVDGPDAGKPWGEIAADQQEHLLAHIDERYYVGSLLVRALEIVPIGPLPRAAVMSWLHYGLGEENRYKADTYRTWVRQDTKKVLRRYLRGQFTLAC